MNFRRVVQPMVLRKFVTLSGHCRRCATTLVVAEHDNVSLSPSSLSTIEAAKQIGGDVAVLIMGHKVNEVAVVNELYPRKFLCAFILRTNVCLISSHLKITSRVKGVCKVLSADHEGLKDRIAEDISPIVRNIATSGSYTHVLAPSSNNGKISAN